ncbi:MAG: 30S ribosomal protein S8e [Candidatus Aenigmarchaeota archaeon]|nr:30S ribosomal protein S8e [Candidatus Aenigmarchaeota archaeon]
MAQWHLRSKRKPSGKLLNKRSKKKKYQRGRDFLPAHIGEPKSQQLRTKGGGEKRLLLRTNIVNVIVKNKAQQTKILSVIGNPADSQFIRRNIITKGAILQTDLGKVKVTSRPGQDGVVNGIMIEPAAGKK